MKMTAKARNAHNAPIEAKIAALYDARRALVDSLYAPGADTNAVQAQLAALTAESDALYATLL